MDKLNRVSYAVICKSLAGQIECGDDYLIKEINDGTLFAVVDGLGHGPEAAFAAKKAIQQLDASADQSIETQVRLCNEVLYGTRGVVMTAMKIDLQYKLAYLAIGNVIGVIWKVDHNGKLIKDSIFMNNGTLGTRALPLPSMVVKTIDLSPGDTVILATDGLKPQFESEPPKFDSPARIAQHMFNTYRNIHDDGLVLVVTLL